MAENQSTHARRWHDDRGELSIAIELLESIPEEIRPYIADGLMGKADRDFHAQDILDTLKSLGKEKIMSLHQAQKKRRSYDQDINLHQIVNTFLVLPEEVQENFAADFLEFTSLMVEYMANCDTFELEPKMEELVKLKNLYVDSGPNAAQQYLAKIHQAYQELALKNLTASQEEQQITAPSQVNEGQKVVQNANDVVLDEQGMRIRPRNMQ